MIRLIIMAFVVGVHTLAFAGGTVTVTLGAVTTLFHTSRELFFLLTTLVLVYNYGHRQNVNWLKFWRRRYYLMFPAYIAWSAIFFLANGDFLHESVGGAIGSFGHDLLDAGAEYHLYFLLVTMQVYAVFPLIRLLLRKTEGHHALLFALAAVYQLLLSAALQYRADLHLHGVAGTIIGGYLSSAASGSFIHSYVLYILGGAIIGWHFEDICANTVRYASAVTVTAVALTGAVTGLGAYFAQIYAGGASPAAASAVFQPVVVIEALCFGWALLAGGLLWSDRGAPGKRFFAAGSASSFGIYLSHPLVLKYVLSLASVSGLLAAVRGAWPGLELLVLLGLFVPVVYACAWLIASGARRTPLSLALTGREFARSKG
jgi:surface polysaccharide O-acyltransferase-like enzyme